MDTLLGEDAVCDIDLNDKECDWWTNYLILVGNYKVILGDTYVENQSTCHVRRTRHGNTETQGRMASTLMGQPHQTRNDHPLPPIRTTLHSKRFSGMYCTGLPTP